MSDHIIKSLQRLTSAPRKRSNMTAAQDALDNLAELRETLEPWLEAAEKIRGAIGEFTDKTLGLAEGYLSKESQNELIAFAEKLPLYIPEEGSELADFEEHFNTVEDGLSELESMLEDRDYSADDRDEKWCEIADACGNLATALDLLSVIGRDLQAEAEASTSSTDNEENEK